MGRAEDKISYMEVVSCTSAEVKTQTPWELLSLRCPNPWEPPPPGFPHSLGFPWDRITDKKSYMEVVSFAFEFS